MIDVMGALYGNDPFDGPGLSRWMDIQDSESELYQFYIRCESTFGWTRWQKFKMWLFKKLPRSDGYQIVHCNELDNV